MERGGTIDIMQGKDSETGYAAQVVTLKTAQVVATSEIWKHFVPSSPPLYGTIFNGTTICLCIILWAMASQLQWGSDGSRWHLL